MEEEEKVEVTTIGHLYSEKIFDNNDIHYRTISDYGLNDVSVKNFGKILQEENPALVLTGTSVQDEKNKYIIEQTSTLAGKRKRIPTLSVLDFWGNYSRRFNDLYSGGNFDLKNQRGKHEFLPDKIAIMDKLAEEAMLKEGFPEEILEITGNPYFDDLIELKNNFTERDKNKVRTDLGLDTDSYLVLFASQPIEYHFGKDESNPNYLGYTEKTALKDLLDNLTKLPDSGDTNLIVKVHPRENKKDLEEIVAKYELPVVVDKKYSTRPTLLVSDIVISPSSTVLVESTYLDKPSISLQPGLKKEDFLITNSLGVTVPVYKHGEIGVILEKLLSDANYAAELYQKRKDFGIDGKATERVTNLIYEML